MTAARTPPPWLRRLLLRLIDLASRPLCDGTPADALQRESLLSVIDLASRPLRQDTSSDPFHINFVYFVEEVMKFAESNVLELGARNSTIRQRFAGCTKYVGVDIHPGTDVDVTCDIHKLSTALGPLGLRFDAVATISTFEHLVMPWKAILEINKVMRRGGLLFIATHPTWPPHELPWDFWRFADGAFYGLLNRATGFEILRYGSGLPCTILPLGTEASTVGILGQPAFMGTSVVARKTADARPDLQWNVETEDILTTQYPLR